MKKQKNKQKKTQKVGVLLSIHPSQRKGISKCSSGVQILEESDPESNPEWDPESDPMPVLHVGTIAQGLHGL